MKNIKILCLAIVSIFCISCQDMITNEPANGNATGTYVKFEEGKMDARLVLPYEGYEKSKITNVVLKCYLKNHSTNIYELKIDRTYNTFSDFLATTIPTPSGDWEFDVKATQPGLPELTATVFKTIESNKTNSVVVELKPYSIFNFIYNAYVPTSYNVHLLAGWFWDGGNSFLISDIKTEEITSGEYDNFTCYTIQSTLEPSTYEFQLTFYNSDNTTAGYYYDTVVIAENNLSVGNKIIRELEATANYETITLKYPVDPNSTTLTWTTTTVSVVEGKKYNFPFQTPLKGYAAASWYTNENYSGSPIVSKVISRGDENVYYAKCVPVGLSDVSFGTNYILDREFDTDITSYTIFEEYESSENQISLSPTLMDSGKSSLDNYNYSFEKIDGNSVEIKVISMIDENISRTYTFTFSKKYTVAYYAATFPDYSSGTYDIKPLYSATEQDYINLINAIHENKNIKVNLDLSRVSGIEIIPRCFVSYPEVTNITSINLPQSTKKISSMAFYNWIGLTSFSMPDTVEEIETSVFYGDSNLKGDFYVSKNLKTIGISALNGAAFDTLTVSSENPNYAGENGLLLSKDKTEAIALVGQTEFNQVNNIIPNSVKKIGIYCFAYTMIEAITIPTSISVINQQAFYNCKNLKSVVLPYSIVELGQQAFSGCTSLKYADLSKTAVTELSDYLFMSDTALREVKLPEGISKINNAFYLCSNLETVNFPNGITEIGERAFYNCSKLDFSALDFSNMEKIGDMAFYNTTISGTLTLPNSLTELGSNAFSNCTQLIGIVFGSGLTEIKENTFYNCKGLTGTLVIPDNIKSIGRGAFSSCSNLTEVQIGSGIKEIPNMCFLYCSSLVSVNIPENISAISQYAFLGCSKLTTANFEKTSGWYVSTTENATSGTDLDLSNHSTAADYLGNKYATYYWYCN